MTLVELMLVVSILAILAAIVIPKYSSANDTARGAAVASQLNTIQKALVLYKGDHNGDIPTQAQLITNQWQVLIEATDIYGDVAGDEYGPYFMQAPRNSFMGGSTTVATDNSGAWQYTPATGVIQAVVPQDIYDRAAEFQLDTGDLVVAP